MKSMYDDALYLQSAVNPGPILRRFLEMIQEIKDEAVAERGGWGTADMRSRYLEGYDYKRAMIERGVE